MFDNICWCAARLRPVSIFLYGSCVDVTASVRPTIYVVAAVVCPPSYVVIIMFYTESY